MVTELKHPEAAAGCFSGWEETLITSCLQGEMGTVYGDDALNPASVLAYIGCFAFFAGEPNRELFSALPTGFSILVPQHAEWERLIEEHFPDARRNTRYATKKNTVFDRALLERYAGCLPEGYTLAEIDGELYRKCRELRFAEDFVSNFRDEPDYLTRGRGVVVLKNGTPVAGAASYTRYREGIEIEVDTEESERRKGLARAACAKLILSCLSEGLYPSWDAQNKVSLHLAETLGYEFSHEYPAYEIER